MRSQADAKRLVALLLFLLTAAVYLAALQYAFLDYDDQEYVTENHHVVAGLTKQGVIWAFGFHAANWHPLTWLSHMLDCQIFGLHPWGHHLTSLLIHSAATALLFLVLARMTGALWRSVAVAALFGWHPLHVESVAWIAERKDVLSAFFFVCALWAYVKWTEESKVQSPKSKVSLRQAVGWYGLTLLFFALGLMSKPMVVTLPFVLLLLDYWPLQRNAEPGGSNAELSSDRRWIAVWSRLAAEKIPFFALSLASSVLTVLAQEKVHAIVSKTGLPITGRLAHSILAYAHYLRTLFFPVNLAVYYPYESGISPLRILTTALALILVTAATVRVRKQMPYLLVGWLWFLGMLVPVIGLVQVGEQAWADRYAYLPSIGLFIAVVWAIAELAERKLQTSNSKLEGSSTSQVSKLKENAALAVPGIVVMLALLAGTALQLRYWKNTRALFEHAARVTPNNHMAITLLGSLMAKEGQIGDAIKNYEAALRIKPGYPEAHFFLGNAFDQQGQTQDAINEYQQVLWYKPVEIQAHILLGADLAKQKHYTEAAVHYQTALKLDPSSAVAHNNLARLLHTEGRLDEAIAHYRAALKSDSSLAEAHNNLGTLLSQKGMFAEGAAELREALRLNPGNPETEYNLAVALNQQERWTEAAELLGKIAPTFHGNPNAHYQFGLALEHQQKTKEAMSEFASALLIQPDFPDALAALSWILATSKNSDFRNGPEAVRMAERACELTGRKDARKVKVLAASYAEVGRFKEAAVQAQTAQTLASGSIDGRLAAECSQMSESFKSEKPWRADP